MKNQKACLLLLSAAALAFTAEGLQNDGGTGGEKVRRYPASH